MTNFTIDDAIERCRDRARISELHHMMHASQEWEQTAVWLERLRDASSTIQVADLDYVPCYPDESILDMRDRQRDRTVEQICGILDGLSEGGAYDY